MSLHNANAACHQELQKQESYYGGYCLYEICYKVFVKIDKKFDMLEKKGTVFIVTSENR